MRDPDAPCLDSSKHGFIVFCGHLVLEMLEKANSKGMSRQNVIELVAETLLWRLEIR